MNTVLEIKNLTKYYGKVLAVDDISFSLQQGDIFGFIGPNGAGKSTTIRSIMNFINKTNGHVFIDGKEFDKNNVELKKQIGYLPSEVYLYEDMSVKETLDFHEKMYDKNIHAKRQKLVELLKVDETKKIEDLSLGNKKKIGIILALMHEPKILILDEPTSGLDPIMQQVFFNLLLEEKDKGTTILYSTHILSEVSKICNRVGIIKNGHLLKVENISEIDEKNLVFVTIVSNDVEAIASSINGTVITCENNVLKLKYEDDINELIQQLSQYHISKMLIEEPTLEDIFLHYYE